MTKKPEHECPFIENHTKNSGIELHALTVIFVFLLFLSHGKTHLRGKIAMRKRAMLKHRRLYPECENKTEDVKDETCRCTFHSPLKRHTRANH